jgi:hypothetical protein
MLASSPRLAAREFLREEKKLQEWWDHTSQKDDDDEYVYLPLAGGPALNLARVRTPSGALIVPLRVQHRFVSCVRCIGKIKKPFRKLLYQGEIMTTKCQVCGGAGVFKAIGSTDILVPPNNYETKITYFTLPCSACNGRGSW